MDKLFERRKARCKEALEGIINDVDHDRDTPNDHITADFALIDCIGDDTIRALFNRVKRWYS